MRENVVKDKSFGFVTFIYWFELLKKTDNLTKDQFESINTDAIEIIKLITATLKSAKAN